MRLVIRETVRIGRHSWRQNCEATYSDEVCLRNIGLVEEFGTIIGVGERSRGYVDVLGRGSGRQIRSSSCDSTWVSRRRRPDGLMSAPGS